MKGSLLKVDDCWFFLVTNFSMEKNRVLMDQERYPVLSADTSKLINGKDVEVDIVVHDTIKYAVIKYSVFDVEYTAKEKAKELLWYFRNFRFHIGSVDAKIMALRIADEMLKNPAIKDDAYRVGDSGDNTTKSFWRTVKHIIKHEL